MRIGVVGTFVRDRIFPYQGVETRSFGGIFFTVSCLANLADSATTIYPIAYVGGDFYDELRHELSAYENVCLDGLVKIDRQNTQVQLRYTGPQERFEITTEPMPPLDLTALRELPDCDAILINLITGTDVDLAALRELRRRTSALIYLDFHYRATDIDEHGKRYYRRPDDWREWVQEVDVLQLNEMEARTLAGLRVDSSTEGLVGFGQRILNNHPSVCHLTLAERGSYLFYEENHDKLFSEVDPVVVDQVLDIIGCGDAFAAGYILHYLSHKSVAEATRFANRVAALNCTFIGSSGVRQLREFAWQI